MPTEDVRRFARQELSGRELVKCYPRCACEATRPYDRGHGPVRDDEALVFFVESPSHADLRKPCSRKRPWAPRNKDLRNITTGRGHLVYRRRLATPDELRIGARKGYDHCVARRGDGTGGIVGVFGFPTASVRGMSDDDVGMTCVLDTPVVAEAAGEDAQMAHADLIWSEAAEPPQEDDAHDAFMSQRLAFEDKLARTLQRDGWLHEVEAFSDVDLRDLLPKVVRAAPEQYPAVVCSGADWA